MKQFSIALGRAMKSVGWNQAELTSNTKAVSQSAFSRYLAGLDLPKPDTLEAICRHFAEEIRADLISAYLTDQIPPSGRNLVYVVTANELEGRQPHYMAGKAAPGSTLRCDLDTMERISLEDGKVAKALHFWASSLDGRPPSSEFLETTHAQNAADPASDGAKTKAAPKLAKAGHR